MRVSEAFWEMAGPLLYSNLIIKRAQPMIKIIQGLLVYVDEDGNQDQVDLDDPKARLLSHVQQITVADHFCASGTPVHPGWFPNLKTLLVLPYAHPESSDWICGTDGSCPILKELRPRKIVIHNSRSANHTWPMNKHHIHVTCPSLTLVINEIDCVLGKLPYLNWISYRGVDWRYVKEIRVIVNRTPPWLDRIAERVTCPNFPHVTSQRLVEEMLSPLIAGSQVLLTIYLFQEMDEAYMTRVQETLPIALTNMPQKQFNPLPQRPPVTYTIKTLSDYIAEGVEDELLWQELKYWREENQRRMKKIQEVV
jgi:hypothetical protein